MSDKISEKIDTYARAHLKELRGKENNRYKLTKYDVAQYMLSQGQLSESDFASWMNTQEGYENLNISNQQKQTLRSGSIFSFDNPLTPQREEAYLDELDTNFKRDSLTGVVLERTTQKQKISSTPSKEIQKEAEIRKNTIEFLLNNAKTALAMINQYHASIGYISSDAIVQGMNTIGNLVWDSWSGRNDFVTVFEQEHGLENEIKTLVSLKSKTTKPKEFEREFKKLYGIDFNPKNFEKLADVSKELNEMNSYSGLSNYFGFGIEKLKDSDTSGLEPASLLAPVFGNNVLKAKEYVEELRKECKDENDLREKLIQILTESKSEADKKLAGFDRAKIENDYKSAYKAAMGEYKSDEIISGYIESSKMNAMLTETGLIVAGSLLSKGSSSLLVLKLGAKEIMKMIGMGAGFASMPAVETIVGGVTSEEGLTMERGEQAWEELKNGLMYGAFGAFVSGPLGNVVSKVLSKNPQIFSKIVSSTKFSLGAGAAVETTADVLFDRITSDLSFQESMAQNGIMNFGMMFVGARMNKAAQMPDISQVKIEKMKDGTYNLKANGRVFFKAKNENELALATLALGAKNDAKKAAAIEPSFKVNDDIIINGKNGSLSLTDNDGNIVGIIVQYDIREQNGLKVLHFEGLESKLAGQGVGTKLIEQLVQKSKELGAEGRLVAQASPKKSVNGKLTNLEFYYKLGFRAADDTKHKQILKCIEQGDEKSLLALNFFTDIYLTPEGINKILNKTAHSKATVPPETKSGVFADLQYSKKSIKDLIESNPDLKNNQWVQENIDTLLKTCSESIYYSGDAPLKEAAGKALTKIQYPLLTKHRLKILNTFLSNPLLYENKSLQQEIKNIISWADSAKAAEKTVKSLEQYASYPNKNEMVDLFAPNIIKNRDLSLENKQKLYDYLAKDESSTDLSDIICDYVTDKEFNLVMEILQNSQSTNMAALFLSRQKGQDKVNARVEMYELIKDDNEISNYDKYKLLARINEENIDFAKKYYKNSDIEDEFMDILVKVCNFNKDFTETLIKDPNFPNELIAGILMGVRKNNIDLAKEIYNNPDVPIEQLVNILYKVNPNNKDFARTLIADKEFPKEEIADLLYTYNAVTEGLIKTLYEDKSIVREDISKIVNYPKPETHDAIKEVYAKLKADKDFPDEYISKVLKSIDRDNPGMNKDYALDLCKNYKEMEIPESNLEFLIKNYGKISPKDLQKLNRVMGRDKVAKLSDSDLLIACQMVDICGKTSINEIPMEGKKNLLRRLVDCNEGLFKISDDMKKAFPLIPTDRETYCSLLPSIVKSLGVDIRTIEPPSRIKEFNNNLEGLSSSVAKLSDNDFAQLEIKLDYPKDEFITDVLAKVKDLSPNERQKVYDYFGFELHHNKNNQTGFSITGYPINLNNGKKLAEITDPKTKAVVESLRSDVVRFSEQNPIKCNNPDIQKLLNDIVDVLPELRTQIGKVQHKTHDYDVFQHSLKVMQKVAQDPKFATLNESDKKIMMLASLLHDITKGEGFADKTHAAQGSFDTFFISKKFNLTPDEEIKLYTLTRHHEWLGYVNTVKSEEQLTKRLQSVAYDLQHDNLFDMALMFTHADLKAVKTDNSFHDTTVGASRTDFNGNIRSFGESADVYANRIKGYIDELKTTQPILPVTHIPKTNRINAAITQVNPDGSTNIKGVYKRPDGLVIIKFNEVEDWEAIGFPKGSVSRGYEAKAGAQAADGTFAEDINTGNIKFFAHGLDYENQLAKFDALSLIDSDVLLSVSYAERPESKYRFFRTQGVLLDFDTKYIHGGGNTDSGSGCGKFIEDFKRDYVFGGERESDRVYVPNLIKNATGMSDADYVKFVEANKNRALTEIEPLEYRDPIIKALASINSNTRKGGRSYNEMYGSNPKEVMGVFAYDSRTPSNVGNPLEFLESTSHRTDFLQKYAIEHDIPFIIFGD